jgi:antitoxin (DNA-binding transcriptional repressor) of toxin-antitoxin stability system
MTVRTVDIADAVQPLADYAQQIGAGPVVVTSGGQPVAVVVAVENADLESISLSLNPEFMEVIERSRARHEKEGGISSEEMRQRFGGRG